MTAVGGRGWSSADAARGGSAVHEVGASALPGVRPVELLWTGGLDSSFRLFQLLLVERRPVRPIYILDSGRPGTLHEIRAVEAMRDGVTARLDDPTMLAPIEIHLRSDVPVRPELMALYSQIAAQVHIGTQYGWLAAAGEAFGWQGVELAMERYEDGPSPLQRLIFDDRGQLNDTPEAQLFRYYSFPVLHLTKVEMAAEARAQGFADLLALRWFCHTPLGGKPCGLCRPCRLAFRDGVDFASPTSANARRLWRKVHGRSASELARRAVGRGSAALVGRAPARSLTAPPADGSSRAEEAVVVSDAAPEPTSTPGARRRGSGRGRQTVREDHLDDHGGAEAEAAA